MVHAIKYTWKLGFGLVSERHASRCHSFIEAGYLIGSLLFAVGTLFFFPVESLEDFALGCRFYEAGSVVFASLTGYSELDRYYARKNNSDDRSITQREILEQLLYCVGSIVFLVGTFLFDPPFVDAFSVLLNVTKGAIENTAAVLFMVGSFMFSFGSYVNALSIFEAPRMFRKHLISVTTSYMFGGLFFIAGTMGYVEAFEPNLTLKIFSTWFYMVGCGFYVTGSFLAFVSTVARQQVTWERVQMREHRKRKHLTQMLGKATSALPRALKAATKRRRRRREAETGASPGSATDATPDAEGDADAVIDDLSEAPEDLDFEEMENGNEDDGSTPRDEEWDLELARAAEEDDVFGAFWRSVTGAGAVSTVSLPATGSVEQVAGNAARAPPHERPHLGLLEGRA